MENIKSNLSIKVPAKASVWYIASGALARGIGALTTPIFTRLLTPSEYGIYPLYNTWLGVLSVLVTLELTGSVIYRGFQKYGDDKEKFTSAALGLLGVVFVGFCTVYFAFYGFLREFTGLNLTVTLFMFAEIFGTAIVSLYLARARYEYKYKAVALINLSSAVLSPALAVVLILVFSLGGEARIFASSTVALLISVPVAIMIIKRSDKLYSGEIWRYLLRRAIPLLPHYFATALILKAGEISIGHTHGTGALGKYSIAMSVGMIMTVVTVGLLSALTPWIMRKIREGSMGIIRDFLFSISKALALLSLGVLAIAPEVMSFLAAEGFRDALPAVYPLEIAVILSFLSGAIMSGCAYYEKNWLSSLPSILAALVSVILSLFVLPNIDYRFAGVFALISYLVLMLLISFVFKRLSGEYPIHLKKGAVLLLLTVGYAALLFVFRGVFLSRLFLALPLALLLILCARDILKMIRE